VVRGDLPEVTGLFADDVRGDLDLHQVAELPQFLGRTRVLEQHPIDIRSTQFAGTVAVDGFADPSNQFRQLGAVVRGNVHSRGPPV